MALNLSPDRVEGAALVTNLAAVERHLNDDHYTRGFTPGSFVIGGAGAPAFVVVTAATPRWSAITMPHGATSYAAVTFDKPSEWRTGHIRVVYWYTSDVGSTNNFYVLAEIDAIRDAEVLRGTTLVSTFTAVTGPAVANTVIRSAPVYTTVVLGSDDELFSLRLTRVGADANDTNVNAFQLLYAKIEHLPAVQVSQ